MELDADTLDQPLANRRGRRENRQPPMRYRDIFPTPPAALPPPLPPSPICEAALPPLMPSPPRKLLRSPRNRFGLFRQYYATQFPEHDPDENTTLDDLVDSPSINLADLIQPYPTLSSFLLGEWYWNDGLKKSQSSFANLLKIVGHPEYQPKDVSNVNWKMIDANLGGMPENRDAGDDWEDEQDSHDGWIETPIRIKVPFHSRMSQPGQEDFEAGKLYHRSLVSIIREKISRPEFHPHLHLEPYELYWQPSEDSPAVKVHGEIYSSAAFVEAHKILQDSPPEPGCNLPRFIIGMMFSSDGTQLTSFGDAKLWPVYLAFGNETKYRRSKPSCHAFEHVAYFETVRVNVGFIFMDLIDLSFFSSQTRSNPSQQVAQEEKDRTAPL